MTDDRNRLLCEWIGIPANVRERANSTNTTVVSYPDLATREGRLLLEEALTARNIRWELASYRGMFHAWFACNIGHEAATPWVALFEAAWALMQREVGEDLERSFHNEVRYEKAEQNERRKRSICASVNQFPTRYI